MTIYANEVDTELGYLLSNTSDELGNLDRLVGEVIYKDFVSINNLFDNVNTGVLYIEMYSSFMYHLYFNIVSNNRFCSLDYSKRYVKYGIKEYPMFIDRNWYID